MKDYYYYLSNPGAAKFLSGYFSVVVLGLVIYIAHLKKDQFLAEYPSYKPYAFGYFLSFITLLNFPISIYEESQVLPHIPFVFPVLSFVAGILIGMRRKMGWLLFIMGQLKLASTQVFLTFSELGVTSASSNQLMGGRVNAVFELLIAALSLCIPIIYSWNRRHEMPWI